MIRKILIFGFIASLGIGQAFAQGQAALDNVTGGVASYIPAVRILCYAIAAIIAMGGAFSVYMAYHYAPQEVKKRTLMTVGGALCFVCMSIALPQFFGLDATAANGGYTSSGSGGTLSNGDSNLSSDAGGIPGSTIDTDIPPLSDDRWTDIGVDALRPPTVIDPVINTGGTITLRPSTDSEGSVFKGNPLLGGGIGG